jgi:hypothetical protein
MNGQWVGRYTAPQAGPGRIILNVDERDTAYEGVAFLLPDDFKAFPGSAASFRTIDKQVDRFQFRTTSLLPIDPTSLLVQPWDKVRAHFADGMAFSSYADVTGNVDGESLKLSWKTDIGATGEANLPRSRADKPSELVPLKKNWTEYKDYVGSLKGRRFLFRGQDGPWRLRTAFHRGGRADLIRFLDEDVKTLHGYLMSRTKHFFKLEVPDELGAFLNLVQHHGYPTPLLDWTYSPYVAAFFAYRHVKKEDARKAQDVQTVRIHVLDQMQWKRDNAQILMLFFPGMNLSIGEFIAVENERMIPQQAVSTFSNIDDIEPYIRSAESADKSYLSVVDLPIGERDHVMEDLSYMGITAGSLFPGLDGTCEELRERNFTT